jgi:hypothetical protein
MEIRESISSNDCANCLKSAPVMRLDAVMAPETVKPGVNPQIPKTAFGLLSLMLG